ncbi:MAG TPA: hypothetical protein VE152_05650, partial [Acidimicrobiales bacterium]|nr:hypothetical protein [Acidimicrobiales bacterium]
MTPRPLALVRSVVGIDEGPGWVDLAVETVSAVHLGPTLGLLTGEDPVTQGVVTGLPNLPPLPALPVDRTPATLRVRFAAPDALRLTLVPARAGEPGDDAPGDGILVDPCPGSGALEVTDEGATVALASDALVCRVTRHPFAVACATTAGEPV